MHTCINIDIYSQLYLVWINDCQFYICGVAHVTIAPEINWPQPYGKKTQHVTKAKTQVEEPVGNDRERGLIQKIREICQITCATSQPHDCIKPNITLKISLEVSTELVSMCGLLRCLS